MNTAEATEYSWTCKIGSMTKLTDPKLADILKPAKITFDYETDQETAKTNLGGSVRYSLNKDGDNNIYIEGDVDKSDPLSDGTNTSKAITYRIWGRYTIDSKTGYHNVQHWWLRLCRFENRLAKDGIHYEITGVSSTIVQLKPCTRTTPSEVEIEDMSIGEETPLNGEKGSKCPNCCAVS
jgi:hypothetical protein